MFLLRLDIKARPNDLYHKKRGGAIRGIKIVAAQEFNDAAYLFYNKHCLITNKCTILARLQQVETKSVVHVSLYHHGYAYALLQ